MNPPAVMLGPAREKICQIKNDIHVEKKRDLKGNILPVLPQDGKKWKINGKQVKRNYILFYEKPRREEKFRKEGEKVFSESFAEIPTSYELYFVFVSLDFCHVTVGWEYAWELGLFRIWRERA